VPTPPLSDELAIEAAEAFKTHGRKYLAARSLGLKENTFDSRLKVAAERGLLGYEPVLPGFAVKSVAAKVGDAWVKQTKEHGEVFEMPAGHTAKGVSALVDADGRVVQQWIKTKQEADHVDVAAMMERVLAGRVGTSAVFPPPTESDPQTFTVIPLVDWHVGLMAWARETGENYDLKIARDTIMNAMAKVVRYSPPSEKCIILGLGDMLHFDGFEPVTSRSHNFLDADGRYPKVLDTAADMIIDTIDMAQQKFAKVAVRILPGNHDDKATVALNLGFRLLYKNNERVDFDNSPSRFWWHREDKVFLGGTHGEKAKMKDLPLVMAYDRPHDWAKSTNRRIYTGHVHHERKIEEGGVIVTSMRSPVAKDAFHSFDKWRSGRTVYSDTYSLDGKTTLSFALNI